jgi:probable rRNA maturation factor
MSDPEDPGGEPYAVAVADEQDLPVDAASLRHFALAALRTLDIPSDAELSIALVSPEAIADLKGRYYGEAVTTDVLSFPMDGPEGPVIGDVVICPAVARRQARGLGRTFQEEMALLLVHGILHLVGRDHATPEDEIAMRNEERRILSRAVAS